MDKIMNEDLRNVHTNTRVRFNEAAVKEVDKFIYLGK
jgi:hypothetical protein